VPDTHPACQEQPRSTSLLTDHPPIPMFPASPASFVGQRTMGSECLRRCDHQVEPVPSDWAMRPSTAARSMTQSVIPASHVAHTQPTCQEQPRSTFLLTDHPPNPHLPYSIRPHAPDHQLPVVHCSCASSEAHTLKTGPRSKGRCDGNGTTQSRGVGCTCCAYTAPHDKIVFATQQVPHANAATAALVASLPPASPVDGGDWYIDTYTNIN
jgi:hypothetical protein